MLKKSHFLKIRGYIIENCIFKHQSLKTLTKMSLLLSTFPASVALLILDITRLTFGYLEHFPAVLQGVP